MGTFFVSCIFTGPGFLRLKTEQLLKETLQLVKIRLPAGDRKLKVMSHTLYEIIHVEETTI